MFAYCVCAIDGIDVSDDNYWHLISTPTQVCTFSDLCCRIVNTNDDMLMRRDGDE
jgi:hypothetical protein